MIKIIIAIILYLLYQFSDASEDVAIENGNQGKWHSWGAVTACLFILAISYCIVGLSWYLPLVAFVLIAFRLPTFNILHNLIKGAKWYYVGKTAWTDRMIRKIFPNVNFDR